MSKQSGKWLPYNLNNGPHDCRNKGKQTTVETKQEPSTKKEYTVEAVLKKLASIGIAINLEELMKHE